MIRCNDVAPRLPSYAADALDASQRIEVESHLAGCRRCTAALAAVRSVEQLAADAPLRPETPKDLEERVFAYVQAYETAQAAREAAVGPEPPYDLERRSLERAGVLGRPRSTRHRVAAVLAPAFAVAAAILSLMYMDATSDRGTVAESNLTPGASPVIRPEDDMPVGHPMQTIELSGRDVAADLELVHFRHNNYRLELNTAGVPDCRPGHYYEVWLRGKDGEVSAGSFRITRPDDMVVSFNVGIDPSEYYLVEVTREPMDGKGSKEGPVVMWGALDPGRVDRD